MSVRRFTIPRAFRFTRTGPGSVDVVGGGDHDALIREAREHVQHLLDALNGCPLPIYRIMFTEVAQRAQAFLEKTKKAPR